MKKENKVKIGDEVRFLNEVGGGRVIRIEGDTLWVEGIDDDFDIPISRQDVVVVAAQDSFLPAYQHPKKAEPTKKKEPLAVEEESSPIVQEGLPIGIYLAYSPKDISRLGQADYEAILVNNTEYSLSYLLTSPSEVNPSKVQLLAEGVIEPHSLLVVDEFAPSELNQMHWVRLQLLFFAGGDFLPRKPLDKTIRLEVSRFFKVHAFKEDTLLGRKVLRYDIDPEEEALELDRLRLYGQRSPARESAPKNDSKSAREKTIHGDNPLVIDLHIDSLVDSTVGMTPLDMLDKQLSLVQEVLTENAKEVGKRIVFIHGKGEGVLRKAVIDLIRHSYRFCSYRDASFREYGYGATEVEIHGPSYDNRRWR